MQLLLMISIIEIYQNAAIDYGKTRK